MPGMPGMPCMPCLIQAVLGLTYVATRRCLVLFFFETAEMLMRFMRLMRSSPGNASLMYSERVDPSLSVTVRPARTHFGEPPPTRATLA